MAGRNAKKIFGGEAGVFRWQRRPKNDKKGRTHSSTITIAILDDSKQDTIKIDKRDIEFKACLASGPGGQHVQKNQTAISLFHKPSNIRIRVETKSQHQNKEMAMRILKSRLNELEENVRNQKRNNKRRKQLGQSGRGDKRRTISVQRNEVIDHKTNKKISYKAYLRGELEKLYN